MPYIVAVIRNQQGVSLPSVDGELIIVVLASNGQVVDQQPVRFTTADPTFANLPVGCCTVVASHPSFNPTEARQDVMLSEKVMLGVKYFYIESERQLLKIELLERRLDGRIKTLRS